MSNYYKLIIEHLNNHDFLTVKQANDLGVGRHVLSDYVKQNKLVRVERGIYSLPNQWVDEYELLQQINKRLVYSYGTALYFHGLSDRVPHTIHVSVPQGYNAQHIKHVEWKIKIHYVKKENFEVGIETVSSPQGGLINVYDVERCVCDIIRDKKHVDPQVFQDAIKRYFNLENKDLRKLLKYSELFNIEKEIWSYIEVLT